MYGVEAAVDSTINAGGRDLPCLHCPPCAHRGSLQQRQLQQQQRSPLIAASSPESSAQSSLHVLSSSSISPRTPLAASATTSPRHRSFPTLPSLPFALNMSSTTITPTQQMMASCSGALITSALVTPFDVIKIRIQSAAAASSQCPKCMIYFNGLMDHVCPASCKPYLPRPSYRLNGNSASSWKNLFKIIRHEGPLVLWSGLPPTLLMAIPNTVIYFTAYDNLKTLLGFGASTSTTTSLGIAFVSGAAARFAAVTVISPLELVRTKMQSASMSYDQIGAAVKDAVSRGGWRSLWSGWTPSVLRDVPFSGFYFCGYEMAKTFYGGMMESSISSSSSISPPLSTSATVKINFLSGATSALFATVLTQPFDVLKTRTQIRLGDANFVDGKNGASPFESVWRSASGVVRVHGVAGLYAGVIPRLMKVIPACAIMITSYEYFKEVFAARNSRRRKEEESR